MSASFRSSSFIWKLHHLQEGNKEAQTVSSLLQPTVPLLLMELTMSVYTFTFYPLEAK